MIVRRVDDLDGTDRETVAETWRSRRFLLAGDGMGFSFHETTIGAGTETRMWYKHHLEAVYCVAGSGTIEDLATGEVHEIADGTMYALNEHDRHVVRATEEMRLICVFNPPCVGGETHDADGAYPPADEMEVST
ncbi:MAG: ectoine synthase [Acidimicrobiales bacterium]|nr:ectoine synthase [Acidimicrobiales bacterium]